MVRKLQRSVLLFVRFSQLVTACIAAILADDNALPVAWERSQDRLMVVRGLCSGGYVILFFLTLCVWIPRLYFLCLTSALDDEIADMLENERAPE